MNVRIAVWLYPVHPGIDKREPDWKSWLRPLRDWNHIQSQRVGEPVRGFQWRMRVVQAELQHAVVI